MRSKVEETGLNTKRIFFKISILRQYFTSLVKGWKNFRLFGGIQTYIMFIGYPRSGHSLVGALLDAHPNIIVAHEQNALQYFLLGFSKKQVFSMLISNSVRQAMSGRMSTGYSCAVPRQFQGKYTKLKVIGDKKGGVSANLLKENPDLFRIMEEKLGIPVKYIHVYRNPFDNITTWARGGNRVLKPVTNKDLEVVITKYFSNAEIIRQFKESRKIEIIDIKHEDLIKQPKESLNFLVKKIGLGASDDYLESCSSIVFENPKKTRHSIDWPVHLVNLVLQNMAKYPWLADYNFDN